jgi:adenylate cyclase
VEKSGTLVIEVTGISGKTETNLLGSIPLESSDDLPQSIINYVARTQEYVILNDLHNEINNPEFPIQNLNDPYIIQHQPKSVLCMPIQHLGKNLGILYLENNLTAGAFTPDRLALLKVLSSQTAISIENAQLYANLEANENRLMQFLEAMPVGVGVINAESKVYYINKKAKEIFGKAAVPDIPAEQLSEVYQLYQAGTLQHCPVEELPIIRALRGETSVSDNLEVRHDDKIIPLEIQATPIYDKDGKIVYAINTLQDITGRKKAEADRTKFMEELFEVNCNLELALDAELEIVEATSRFVPNQFLSFLGCESIVDVKLGDQVELEMSVLFSDIRDFTTLSEQMTPENNFKFINSYLSRMEPSIVENHGFIDKYIGDAIMALFSEGADDAVKAGIAMLHDLVEYNQYRAAVGYIPIQIGIGINTGSLMLGIVGGPNRMEGTVISDTVNLASRIESLTKNYGVSLLITQQTFDRLTNPADYAIRVVDRVQVKGKVEMVTIYEIFDADLPEVKAAKLATLQLFSEAVSLYNADASDAAAVLFAECLRQHPRDRVAQFYLQRCR